MKTIVLSAFMLIVLFLSSCQNQVIEEELQEMTTAEVIVGENRKGEISGPPKSSCGTCNAAIMIQGLLYASSYVELSTATTVLQTFNSNGTYYNIPLVAGEEYFITVYQVGSSNLINITICACDVFKKTQVGNFGSRSFIPTTCVIESCSF